MQHTESQDFFVRSLRRSPEVFCVDGRRVVTQRATPTHYLPYGIDKHALITIRS